MREKKICVSKIVIQIGDKEAALTVEQARELSEALNALLGEKVIEKVVERYGWYPSAPYTYHPSPYWTVVVGDQPQISGTTTATNSTSGFTAYLTSNGDSDLLPV
jgi:hypothetical protein